MTKPTILKPLRETTQKAKTIGNKEYIITSVFLGSEDVQSTILRLAEKKAVREMGLDMLIER